MKPNSFFICKYCLIKVWPHFLMFPSSLVCSQCSFHSNVLTHACLIRQDMSFILSLALHRRLSEFLGEATCDGFKHDAVIWYLWWVIMPWFLLSFGFYTVLKPYSVFLCVCVCWMTMKLRHLSGTTSLYILLNCVLHMWFLALRLTRQEHSAPTLGDMIEKVLPGK